MIILQRNIVPGSPSTRFAKWDGKGGFMVALFHGFIVPLFPATLATIAVEYKKLFEFGFSGTCSGFAPFPCGRPG